MTLSYDWQAQGDKSKNSVKKQKREPRMPAPVLTPMMLLNDEKGLKKLMVDCCTATERGRFQGKRGNEVRVIWIGQTVMLNTKCL